MYVCVCVFVFTLLLAGQLPPKLAASANSSDFKSKWDDSMKLAQAIEHGSQLEASAQASSHESKRIGANTITQTTTTTTTTLTIGLSGTPKAS